MVLDGGGRFIPAGIVGSHTLSVLLAFLVAHDRATEDTHTHTHRESLLYEHQTNTIDRHYRPTLNVGTVHNPRQGGIDFFPL